jgi:PAS domain S-box-containing protein
MTSEGASGEGGFGPGFDVYRALVEGIPAILYIDSLDEWSTNWYTSPQAERLLGFTVEEWGTTPDLWLQRIHPEDRDRVKDENDRSNESREPFKSEYRFITKDGRTVWLRDEALVVTNEGERPFWRGFMHDITAQKEAEEKLRWSLEVLRRTIQQRRELALRLETSQEEERRRIAADIHDDPIQVMSAVDLRMGIMVERDAPVAPQAIADLQVIVRQSIERLRSLLFELRPLTLDREGLIVALTQYLDHTAKETGWTVQVVDQLEFEPDPELRATLYRIAQEAIANARKHAGASGVVVTVITEGDGVTIRISDDGSGFDAGRLDEPTPGHLGLVTMIERAELMGGWCRVSSVPSEGTTVECWLPSEGEVAADAPPGRTA